MEERNKSYIVILNEQQKIYYISSQFSKESKNSIYIGYRRIFLDQDRLKNMNDSRIKKNDDNSNNNFNNTNQETCSNNKSDINNNTYYQSKDNELNYDEKKCFALKLIPYYNELKVMLFEREKNILDLFNDDDRIIKYRKIIEVYIKEQKYVLASMDLFVNFDLFFYFWKNFSKLDENFLRMAVFQALQIL